MLQHLNLIPDSGCGIVWLLGAFTNLWKATFSCAMSVWPPVHVEQLGSHWIDLMKFDIKYFLKICQENSSVIKIW